MAIAVQTDDIANRFAAAATTGDGDGMREVLHPDAVIWHNYDRIEMSVEELVTSIVGAVSVLRNVRYEDVKRHPIASGYVQQHVLRGETADGRDLLAEVCVVARVEDGLIVRYDEYMDSAALAVLAPG